MKKLLAALGLMLIPAFGAGDPDGMLPNKRVTIHATLNGYDAFFAVAKILGVNVSYVAQLQSTPFKLDLTSATGSDAFDKIVSSVNQPIIWGTQPDRAHPGQVLVIVSDPPAPGKP